MEISDVIRERIIADNAPYLCNDNISQYIKEGEKNLLILELEKKMESVLKSLIINTEEDHNTRETAHRVAKMWVNEIFAGRYHPAPDVTSFPNVGYNNLYTCGPISIRSTCAHHFQNIVGKCWVGVLPQDEVIGLSKFNRIVHHISERPQIQEEMTTQIADALVKFSGTPNIAVVVKAEHHCMTHRGVREHESDMTTAVLRGRFLDDKSLKTEFYQVLSLKQ
jgi:GTP cyclohydrolase I